MIHQMLIPGGYYVTQQVGEQTNAELLALFNSNPNQGSDLPRNLL